MNNTLYRCNALIIKSNSGLFTVYLDDTQHPLAKRTCDAVARGALRQKGSLLVGDHVEVSYEYKEKETDIIVAIEKLLPANNRLIRPAMANLDFLFVTISTMSPTPDFETIDKLICIAEYNHIEPIILITKMDLNRILAQQIKDIYVMAGYDVYLLDNTQDCQDRQRLNQFIKEKLHGKIAALSGASGVGKSTTIQNFFPNIQLEIGDISKKIERGKNTTRLVELYKIDDSDHPGFLADTPGFTMLDFERFDFFSLDDLFSTFREFRPYLGKCKYTNCSHVKESDCAIVNALNNNQISLSRHKSYASLYAILKQKKLY